MCVRACTSARTCVCVCVCVCVCMWDRKVVRACCRRCWQRRREKKKKTIRRKECDKEKLSSGKIKFEKLVANAETSTVLHRQAYKAAPCSAEAEVDSPNNGKLGLYPDPRHDNRVRLIPLCGKAACQAFLVRGVLPMEDGIGGTNQWCKRAAHVLTGASVLPLLCFRCLPGDGIPR